MKKNLRTRLAIAIGVIGLIPMCAVMTEANKSYASWQEGNQKPTVGMRSKSDDLTQEVTLIELQHRGNHPEVY